MRALESVRMTGSYRSLPAGRQTSGRNRCPSWSAPHRESSSTGCPPLLRSKTPRGPSRRLHPFCVHTPTHYPPHSLSTIALFTSSRCSLSESSPFFFFGFLAGSSSLSSIAASRSFPKASYTLPNACLLEHTLRMRSYFSFSAAVISSESSFGWVWGVLSSLSSPNTASSSWSIVLR